MKSTNIKKLSIAGILCAAAVVGSLFSFPVFGSKCAPVQHMVNVFCAVLLGPGYGVMVAFVASLIRNMLGIGSLMAFPGSMFGALVCGVVYKRFHNIIATMIGEVAGTSIFLMGKNAANLAFYVYVFPFFVSTAVGALISGMIVLSLKSSGLLAKMQQNIE